MELDLPIAHNKKIYSVLIVYLFFRTKPTMSYHQEYQKGPMHVGLSDLQFRAYTWTKEKVDKYIKMKEQEDLMLLETIDGSVKAAMEALGDELEKYLREAGEEIQLPKEKKFDARKTPTIYDPFVATTRGVLELFGIRKSNKKKEAGPKLNKQEIENEKGVSKKDAKGTLWQAYKNFKKRNKCLNW